MFKKLANAAQSLKEKADDIAEKVETNMQFAADKYEAGKEGVTTLFEQHWPSIEHVLVEGLLTVAEEKLKDDKLLESTFLKFYELLPVAARFVLTRDRFVEFTMARRDPLLLKLQEFRAARVLQGGVLHGTSSPPHDT